MVRTAPLGPCSRDPGGTNAATPSPSGQPHQRVKLDAPAVPLGRASEQETGPRSGKVSVLRQNAGSETPATSGPTDGSCASHSDTGLSSAAFPTPWGTDPSQGLGVRLVTGWIKP
ncbi:unnamed protein product [Rangifer tarandus platyrhynchus]|uniref:Uncharacterized protein n=2 Tax=Rangifer tarandus platyrhynchus TaxID=3082113 RepID=A0ABN8ZKT3_RANTA|nr:unnamed protein product [Rangifer tarandus platyrhynchus]